MKSFRKPGAIQEEIAAVTDEAQALLNVAKEEDRDLTDEESGRWNAIMNSDDGELAKLEKELENSKKVAAEVKRLASLRASASDSSDDTVIAPKPAANDAPSVRLITPRLRAFQGPDAIRNAYDSGMWLSAIISNGRNQKAVDHCRSRGIRLAQTGDTNTEGGHTVPDPLSNAVINIVELAGVARKVCRTVPMTSDTLNVPKRTSGLTVQYTASLAQAAAISETDKVWEQVSLTAQKRATLTKVSNELLADSVINIIDDLAFEIGHAFAYHEDDCLINGDGTATYGNVDGLINDIGSAGEVDADSGETTFASLDMEDFHELVALLPEQFHAGASWIVSRTFFHEAMERLAIANGISTMQPQGIISEGASRSQFLGYPIHFSSKMPAEAVSTVCALFGDFRQSVLFGDRGDLSIKTSDQFAFDEDVVSVRATYRYDINVHEDGDGSNAGGYVALKLAAS